MFKSNDGQKNTALTGGLWWHPKRIAIAKMSRSYRSITLFSSDELENYLKNERYAVAVSPEDRRGNVHFIAFDVDSGRRRDMENLYNAILELTGTPPLVSNSGGKGWHLWIFFDKPLGKQTAITISEKIADRAGVLGLQYLSEGEKREEKRPAVEVIPAYDACIKLPGQKHPRTGKVEEFIDLEGVPYDTQAVWEGLAAGMFRVPVEKLFFLLPVRLVKGGEVTKEADKETADEELKEEVKTTKIEKEAGMSMRDDKIIDNIWDLTRMEEVALQLTPGVSRIGQGFYCVLPGHKERRKSAAWYKTDSNVIIYKDFHVRDGHGWYSIPEVYAALKTGKVRKMDWAESTKWLRMLAQEFGYRTTLVLEMEKLFQTMQPTIRDILSVEGGLCGKSDKDVINRTMEFIMREAVSQAEAGFRELAASKRYVADKTGISPEKVNRAMNLLCVLGALEKVHGTGGIKGDRYVPAREFNEAEAWRRWEALGRPSLRQFSGALVTKLFGEDFARGIFRRREDGTVIAA